jgi:hypothetical protein
MDSQGRRFAAHARARHLHGLRGAGARRRRRVGSSAAAPAFGSLAQLFPYKGILDKLANRCLADGTNAWTATDHTCYTMESAGHEGCLNLLPIYADHILYPTLTDSCFHTEVHHVTGEGEDKGVVYCEMQARENNSGSLVDRAVLELQSSLSSHLIPSHLISSHLIPSHPIPSHPIPSHLISGAVLELLYPTGGYSSETGGKMSNLQARPPPIALGPSSCHTDAMLTSRVRASAPPVAHQRSRPVFVPPLTQSLTNAAVTRYHRELYRPVT